jgi:hypothetical protein
MNYITLEFTSSTALFHPSSPVPGTVSASIIFAFKYICILYLHYINIPTLFPATSPLSPVPIPPRLLGPVPPCCSLILEEKREKIKRKT